MQFVTKIVSMVRIGIGLPGSVGISLDLVQSERARANSNRQHVNSQSANVLLLPNQKRVNSYTKSEKIIVTIQKNYFKGTAK